MTLKCHNIEPATPIKHFYKITIFIIAFLIFHTISAQNILFKNYSIKDGLPSSEAYNVMQDSKGFMWFCTDGGVSRFDGYQFKTFNTSNGLPDNAIYEAMEDYKGRIWFRSGSGRLSYYFNDSIFKLPINDSLVKILKHSLITSLSVDSNDNIYLGIHGSVYPMKINMRKHCSISYFPIGNYTSYVYKTPGNRIINGEYGRSDSLINTHISIPFNIYRISSGDVAARKLASFTWDRPNISEAHDNAVLFSGDNIATSLPYTFIVIDKDYHMTTFNKLNDAIFKVVTDKRNNVWVIQDNHAPFCYTKGKVINYPALNFLADKHITSLVEDAEGGLWFTSLINGIYYLKSLYFKTWTKDNGLTGNKISSLSLAPDSTIWVTSFEQKDIMLLHSDDSIEYRSIPYKTGESITSILFHPDMSIWVNTTYSLYIHNNSHDFIRLPTRYVYSGGHALILNADGSVWNHLQSRVTLIKRIGDSLKIEKELEISSKVLKICPDKENGLWISSIKNSLIHYSNGSLTNVKLPQASTHLTDLLVTKAGILCATSDVGIFLKNMDKIIQITTDNGLVSNSCRCVCQDTQGNLWIGTDKGLSHVNLASDKDGNLKITSIQNIHAPSLEEINCLLFRGNNLYVGTNNGLTAFNTNNTLTDTVAPPIYITGLKINTNYIAVPTKSISLHYDENYISINYLGLSYADAGNLSYRYKLQGIDTGWIYTKSTNVQYPKLASGSYMFVVSARNADGTWSKHPAGFSFVIEPPLWATWWAKVFYGILAAGLIYWRIKTVEIREKRKTEINRQLVAAEIRELRANFDPHFLFNSLNTLTHLVENKEDEAPEFVSELSKFYRYTLQFREHELMDLENEIKQARRYIHLIKIRFGEQFIDRWNIEEKYLANLIPTYSLQLLLENIIKHNIIVKDNPLHIEIEVKDDMLTVKNDLRLKKADGSSTGHGLESINERYRLLAGKKITISQTSEYFCVSLPLISENYESPDHRRRDTGSESA